MKISSHVRVLHRKPQSVGGALRGLHDDVHPEVESLPLWRMFHRLLLKPQDQLQVLHHRAQIPGGRKRIETSPRGINTRVNNTLTSNKHQKASQVP